MNNLGSALYIKLGAELFDRLLKLLESIVPVPCYFSDNADGGIVGATLFGTCNPALSMV